MSHTGKLGSVSVSAPTPFIVRFADGQVLDFKTLEDACGFLGFYQRSPTARTENPAKVYFLKNGAWQEKPC
jgi:hypothetical protein